ncbi:hypothetical protein [Actinophytocola sp.]|uniref:hypothetical protein n=1 Tax=Actinophytocola sp. TaxID=1872138 RepID=UPI002D7ED6C8|nr:hypothetical protein [Actinophytocola sp.]
MRRRLVHLERIAGPPAAEYRPVVIPRRVAGPDAGRWWSQLSSRDGWLWLAERTVGGLASTLRTAFLLLAGFAAVIVLIGVAFGFGGVLLGGLVGVALLLVKARLLPSRG